MVAQLVERRPRDPVDSMTRGSNPVVVSGLYDQWQADLCDVSNLKTHNSGYRYLLTVIDVFSKVAHVRPLKTKTGRELVKAFEDILQHSPRAPRKLQTDKGSEFKTNFFNSF